MNKPDSLKSRLRIYYTLLSAGVLLLLMCIGFGIRFGAAYVNVSDVFPALLESEVRTIQQKLLRDIRIPRVFASGIVGACFAASGAIMQAVTQNPIADSGLLGINSGASFTLAACFALIPDGNMVISVLCSFSGAALGLGMTWSIAKGKYGAPKPERLILAGVAVSLFFTAASQFISIYFGIGQELTYWNMGGSAGIGRSELLLIAPFFSAGFIFSMLLKNKIVILSLGEESASGLGVNVRRVRRQSIVLVLFMARLAVSLVGPVAFVGLIIPQLLRIATGEYYNRLIPLSFLYGASFFILTDFVSRMIQAPYETPVGIVTALIGVPFFFMLTRKRHRA